MVRAVSDERVKLARELHDLLPIIEKTTRRTLREMRLLVGVLRCGPATGPDL